MVAKATKVRQERNKNTEITLATAMVVKVTKVRQKSYKERETT